MMIEVDHSDLSESQLAPPGGGIRETLWIKDHRTRMLTSIFLLVCLISVIVNE